jgi:hypothetical protein
MKATTLLRDQHRTVERLLETVCKDRRLRTPLVMQLVEELMTHLSLEDHFLGALAERAGVPMDSCRGRHPSLRNAVLQVVFAEADDDVFQLRLRELHTAFVQHARASDRDLLTVVESRVRGDELERLGDRMEGLRNGCVGPPRRPAGARAHDAAESSGCSGK